MKPWTQAQIRALMTEARENLHAASLNYSAVMAQDDDDAKRLKRLRSRASKTLHLAARSYHQAILVKTLFLTG